MPKVQAQPDANTGRRRGRRVTTSLSEINVIPLVDVMLVLLIIFMVAAPMLQKGVEVNRKMLADIAVRDPEAFRRFAEQAREAAAA